VFVPGALDMEIPAAIGFILSSKLIGIPVTRPSRGGLEGWLELGRAKWLVPLPLPLPQLTGDLTLRRPI
jgi:hypothetical protein